MIMPIVFILLVLGFGFWHVNAGTSNKNTDKIVETNNDNFIISNVSLKDNKIIFSIHNDTPDYRSQVAINLAATKDKDINNIPIIIKNLAGGEDRIITFNIKDTKSTSYKLSIKSSNYITN